MTYHPESQQETIDTFNRLYNNLPHVLHEQMGTGEHCKRFLQQVNAPQ